MKCVDPVIPTSALIARWENHRDVLIAKATALPWWHWRKRAILAGSIAAYDFEINTLLELAAKQQPVLRYFDNHS